MDLNACLEVLRGWAWDAATSDPISGVGDWKDDRRSLAVIIRDVLHRIPHSQRLAEIEAIRNASKQSFVSAGAAPQKE